MTTRNLPTENGGIPWVPIILAVVVVGGVGYLSYQAINSSKLANESKTSKNERR
jgi:threonine/homoserine/homoserine lactone efflux protein